MCIDSSIVGIDESVKIVVAVVRLKWQAAGKKPVSSANDMFKIALPPDRCPTALRRATPVAMWLLLRGLAGRGCPAKAIPTFLAGRLRSTRLTVHPHLIAIVFSKAGKTILDS